MNCLKKALFICLMLAVTVGVIEGMAQLAYRITCGEAYKESHFNARGQRGIG